MKIFNKNNFEIIKKIFIHLINILLYPIYIISFFIPKDNELCIFGSGLGKEFFDNSKYLFLNNISYYDSNCKKKIWLTKNKKIIAFLKRNGYQAYHFYSVKGIFYSLRAKKAFISYQISDINKYLTGGTEIIQLWHGIPMKKIGYKGDWDDSSLLGKLRKLLYIIIPYSYYMKCDKLIVPSHNLKSVFDEAFKFAFRKDKRIIIGPYPRWICLNNNFKFNPKIFPEINFIKKWKKEYKYLITWMPTHRRQLNNISFKYFLDNFGVNLSKINEYCKKKEILFIIKPHFLDYQDFMEIIDDIQNEKLNILIYKYKDPYPLLNKTDILITDYSSVYFDFLIMNKPIIFFPFDLQDYTQKVGMYFSYQKIAAGKICINLDSLLYEIENILNGNDTFKNKRKNIKDKFIDIKCYEMFNNKNLI